jgi:hypothetical protein
MIALTAAASDKRPRAHLAYLVRARAIYGGCVQIRNSTKRTRLAFNTSLSQQPFSYPVDHHAWGANVHSADNAARDKDGQRLLDLA